MEAGRQHPRRARPPRRGAGGPPGGHRLEAGRTAAVSELLYGRNPVLEALRAGRKIARVQVAQGAHGQPIREVIAEAEARGVPVEFVPRARLDAVAAHHQGVVAETPPFAYVSLAELLARLRQATRPPLLLAIDGLQDPQNLGTLLRAAAGLGADGVVLPERRTVGVTATVAKAAAGAIERLPIARVTNLVRALEEIKQAGLWVFGLAADGRCQPWEIDLVGPTALVVGSEGTGLGRLVRETCDDTMRIPMPGRTESLNAAVAGAIALYETVRQRSCRPA